MAAGRDYKKHWKLNNSETVLPIVTKFKPKLRLGTLDMIVWSKMKLFKIQDGRRPTIEIY